MKRSAPMQRSGYIKRRVRVKPVNAKRKAKNTERAYGMPARREWIRWQPCLGCGATPCDNAHTPHPSAGMGFKGDYESVVPLCRPCHRAFDGHKAPFDTELAREAVQFHAAFLAARWEQMGEVRA